MTSRCRQVLLFGLAMFLSCLYGLNTGGAFGRTRREPPLLPSVLLRGNLHSHTEFSDALPASGQTLFPDNVYYYARNDAGFQFWTVSDHAEDLDGNEWAEIEQSASANTIPGLFSALRGFEWTGNREEGHVTIIGTTVFLSREVYTLADLIDVLPDVAAASRYGARIICQFNHPGRSSSGMPFRDFAYEPEIDPIFALLEVGNGWYKTPSTRYLNSEPSFIRALQNGWHVAPSNDQDNHTYNDYRPPNHTGIWVAKDNFTVADIMEALQNRHVFASEDENASLRVVVNGRFFMGSRAVPANARRRVKLMVQVRDEDPTEINGVAQVFYGQRFSAKYFHSRQFRIGTSNWNKAIVVPFRRNSWYFVKVVQKDQDTLYSAPIWTVE